MSATRRAGMVAFARETWLRDGAEGETVHELCDSIAELEKALSELAVHANIAGYFLPPGGDAAEQLTEALESARKVLR